MRQQRLCSTPGCPSYQPCGEHARPTRQHRGYTAAYDQARRDWAPRVAVGGVTCWRCGRPISARDEWHLGHDDQRVVRGPEHARNCNLRAAGRKTHTN